MAPTRKHNNNDCCRWIYGRGASLVFSVLFTAALTWHLAIVTLLDDCHDKDDPVFAAPTKRTLDTFAAFAAIPSKPTSNLALDRNNDLEDEDIPSRVWTPFAHQFPCYPPGKAEKNALQSPEPCHEGILFQRPTKVGSTTMTNVVLRLVHNRAAAHHNNSNNSNNNAEWKNPPRCVYRAFHGTAVKLEYAQRNRAKSFLFSLVRDPTTRMISEFFHFRVSVHQVEPTDPNFRAYVLHPSRMNYLLRDLTTDPIPTNTTNYLEIVSRILDAYDFIAVTERMDESLVAMKLLLGLTVEEILYARASRSAGSFSNGPAERPCLYIIPSFLTDGMRRLFGGKQWLEASRGDRILHAAANKSLDRTINEVFGRDTFETELREFRNAQAYAESVCRNRVVGMCDATGTRIKPLNNTCYIWGEGCDHVCLNERIPPKIPQNILDGKWNKI